MEVRINRKKYNVYAFDIETHNDEESIAKRETSMWLGCLIDENNKIDEEESYLYNMNDVYYFMNMDSYEQLELAKSAVGDDANFLKENLEVYITSFEGEILGIDLPDKVELVVTHTEPAVKGNTTTNALKDAECETGLMVRVPLFVEEGERIIVSTADGKYVSRA